tara:strand:- start:16470 stop:16859 length:390 start_codon:yes stop_codon:yes gene_type:complete
MPDIVLDLKYPVNESCQVGDIAYYTATNSIPAGFTVSQPGTDIVKIGKIIKIVDTDSTGDGNLDLTKLTCDMSNVVTAPSGSDFIFFAKDRRVNETAILGYYNKVKFQNNSRQKAELFSASCEVTGNSE